MIRELTEGRLEALGESLGRDLPPGTVVWLEGELGAGKTTLVRAIARGRGATDPATSPTFALVHRYEGPGGPVCHVDCYRLRSPEEAS
jgi:tRNA threonylcarbamoyladenosine biosynthesis protein TsaE